MKRAEHNKPDSYCILRRTVPLWCDPRESRSLLAWFDCSEKAKQFDFESSRLQDVKQTRVRGWEMLHLPPHMVPLWLFFQSFKLITREMNVWFGSAWPRRKNIHIHIPFMERLIKCLSILVAAEQNEMHYMKHTRHRDCFHFHRRPLLLNKPYLPKMKALWRSLTRKPWDLTFQ